MCAQATRTISAEAIASALNREGKAMRGSKALVLGVAYKQDIDDYRESPALRVIERLEARGAEVSYYDPWVPRCQHKEEVKESIPDLRMRAAREATHSGIESFTVMDASIMEVWKPYSRAFHDR